MLKSYKVFIVYARKDADYLEELRSHLRPMERAGIIQVWSDREIDCGAKWEDAIFRSMDTADIILLMVSSSYYVSSYIHEKELKYALSRHEKGEVKIIPIIVRPCNYLVDSVVSSLQVLPKDAKPVTDWKNRDKAWLDVVSSIQDVVNCGSKNFKYKDATKHDPFIRLFEGVTNKGDESRYSILKKFYLSLVLGLISILFFFALRDVLKPKTINNTTHGNNSGIFNDSKNIRINYNNLNDSIGSK